MKTDARVLIAPLLAVALLILTARQTLEALKDSGAWRRPAIAGAPQVDPYARLDHILGQEQPTIEPALLRDPFSYRKAAVRAPQETRPTPPRTLPSAPPPLPVLTSLTWSDDQDPRATIRYNGRDYAIGVNSLFAGYRVISITRSQVVLEQDGERVVLVLRSKGE